MVTVQVLRFKNQISSLSSKYRFKSIHFILLRFKFIEYDRSNLSRGTQCFDEVALCFDDLDQNSVSFEQLEQGCVLYKRHDRNKVSFDFLDQKMRSILLDKSEICFDRLGEFRSNLSFN